MQLSEVSYMQFQTKRLTVALQTREQVQQMVDAMSEDDKAQISPEWLSRVLASDAPDPWVHGFRILQRDSGEVIGSCGFKGPPVDGMIEIAYDIDVDHRGKGYATEAARALVEFASAGGRVRVICAHTLPESVASKRVLEKCGFRYVGESVDPEDGTVSRFERWVSPHAGAAEPWDGAGGCAKR